MWALLECMPTTLMLPFLQLLYLIFSPKSIVTWDTVLKWIHDEHAYRRRPNKPKQSKQISRAYHWCPKLMVSVLLSGSGHFFQCTLQLKYTKVLLSHTSIIAALYWMAWPNSLVKNFKNFKIVLSELSPNLAMILVPDFFLTQITRLGQFNGLERLNKRLI